MSDLKIQGEVSLSTEGAEAALGRVGDKAGQMAATLQKEAGKAGQAVDSIGSGAGKSAEQFTRAESRISDAIKRATTNLELLGKTASQKLEFNIASKGLDPAKFEPALAKLREMEKAQIQTGISAGQMSAALRGLPAQFSDIATSLASGQKPLTVFMQQGGQLKDMFGGIGPAARAMGGYIAGLVNPVTLAAAATVGLAVAWKQGSEEAQAYNKALIMTGNVAGYTASQLQTVAQNVSKSIGTQSAAAAVLVEMANNTKIASQNFEQFARVALQMEKAVGKSTSETVKELQQLGEAPVEASEKLNKQYHFLTAAIYSQIQALQEQGRTEEAAAVAQRAYADAFDQRSKQVLSNLGFIDRALNAGKDAFKSFWDAALDVGRPNSAAEQIKKIDEAIAGLESRIARMRLPGGGLLQNWLANRDEQELAGLRADRDVVQRGQNRSAIRASDVAIEQRMNEMRIEWDKQAEQSLTRQQQLTRELNAARTTGITLGLSEEKINERLTAIRKKYADIFNDGINSQIEAIKRRAQVEEEGLKRSIAQLQVRHQIGALNDEDSIQSIANEELKAFDRRKAALEAELALTKGKQNSLKDQKAIEGQLAVLNEQRLTREKQLENDLLVLDVKRNRAAFDQYDSLYNSAAAGAESLRRQLQAQLDYNNALGMTKEGVIALEAAQLRELAVEKDREAELASLTDWTGEWTAKLREQAEQLRKLADAKVVGAQKEAMVDMWRSIDNAAHNAFTHIFEGGKSVFDRLKESLKSGLLDLLYQMTVKKWILNVGATVTGVPGLASAATATSGASSLLQNASLLSAGQTLWQGFSGGLATAVGGGFSGLGTAIGATGMAGFGSGLAAAGGGADAAMLAYAQSIGNASAGASAGATIGAAMPYVAAALALAAAWKPLFGRKLKDSGIEGTITGDSFTGDSFEFYKGGVFRSDKTKASEIKPVIRDTIGAAVEQMHDSFANLGKTIGAGAGLLDDFTHTFKVSLKGLSKEDAQKAIERTMASASDAMAESFVNKFRDSIQVATQRVVYDPADSEYGPQLIARTINETNTVLQTGLASQLDPFIEDIIRIFDKQKESLAGVEDSEGKLAQFTQALFGLGDALSENEGFIRLFGEALDFDKLEASAKAGESVMDTFARLNTVFTATNSVAATLGKDIHSAFGAIGVASTEARQRLIDLTGGIDSLAAGNAFFSENFLSEAERLAPIQKAVSEEMARLGQASVTTHEQFGALVKGLDLSAESDARLYAGLMKVQGAFDIVADAAVVAAENERTLAEKRMGLQEQIMQLEGNAAGALASQRERELASMEESLRPLQERIWLLQDEATAAAKAKEAAHAAADAALGFVDAAFAGLQRSVQAERANIQAIYDGEVKAIRDRAEAAKKAAQEQARISSDSLNTIKGVFNSLDSTLKAVMPMSRAAAQGILKSALELSNAGGSLSNVAGLEEALQVISRPDESQFATLVDFKRDQALTASTVAALKLNAGDQVSVAEMTLDAINASIESIDTTSAAEMAALDARHAEDLTRLDGILSSAQAQIDALHGIDTSVLSVEAAIMRLAGSISAAKLNPVVSAASQVADAYKSELGRAASQSEISFWKDQVAGGRSTSDVIASIANSREAQIVDLYRSLLGREADQAGLQHQYSSGLSIDQIRANIMSSDEYLKRLLPHAATGTNSLPRDMPIFAHEGERIIPKADNKALIASLRNPQANSEALAAEVRLLREEVAAFRRDNSAENLSIAQHGSKVAKTLDRLSPDGNTLAVKVEA